MQWVNCVLPLLSNNQFSVLDLHELEIDKDISDTLKSIELTSKQLPSSSEILHATHQLHKLKWEKRMPQTLKICSLEPGPNCIMLPIHLKTTDTMEEASSKAMVNTGATGDFINQDFVRNAKLPTLELSQPILVYNVNGTLNEARSIHEVVDIIIIYGGHSEQILF